MLVGGTKLYAWDFTVSKFSDEKSIAESASENSVADNSAAGRNSSHCSFCGTLNYCRLTDDLQLYHERQRLNHVDPSTRQPPARIRCGVQQASAKKRASYADRSGLWCARHTASKRVRSSPDVVRNVPGVRRNFHLELARPVKSAGQEVGT